MNAAESMLSLERLGIYSQWDLLALAEKAMPPQYQPDDSVNWFADVPFYVDGWTVRIFYDCGELDYIDAFTGPDGTTFDFWEWSDRHPWKRELMHWSGVGDMERLRALHDAYCVRTDNEQRID